METPQYYASDEPLFMETPSLKRSDADRFVKTEVEATRSAAGLLDTSVYGRYEVSGPGAERWLNHLLANRLPEEGRIRLAPMLSPSGRLMGDLTVTRLSPTRFWLIGSYYLQEWHLRWFNDHLPATGVTIQNLSESWLGFSLSGPKSRDILARLTKSDVSNTALPFMSCQTLDVGRTQAVVARLSLTGELGYELTVPASQQRALWQVLMDAGTPLGMKPIGMRAQDSLRLEKGYGVWSLEFSASYTPAMCGLERFIDFNKGDFIGREAALAASKTTPNETLVLIRIDALDADVTGYEPIYHQDQRVGFITSGCYGHHVKESLALAYVQTSLVRSDPSLSVTVVGEPRAARILREPPYDPKALKLRS